MLQRIRAAWSALTGPVLGPVAEHWRGWNQQLRTTRSIAAAYEAALKRDDLWQLADFRDADAAHRPDIRRTVRSRSRYERSNNPLIDRVVNVWTGDVVGESGPWLLVNSGDKEVDDFIETAWARWWEASNQAGKLQTAVQTEANDGEHCGIIISDPEILEDQKPDAAVSVDVLHVEGDRLANPNFSDTNLRDYIDGIHLNPYTRRPMQYDVLRVHPGAEYQDVLSQVYEYDSYSSRHFQHAFRKLRPEQHRGMCRYVTSLPIAGLLRKYCEAEVTRAQIVSAFAFIIKSSAPPGVEEDDEGGNEESWWQSMTLPNRQGIGTILPDGYDITQLKADGAAGNVDLMNKLIAGHVGGCFTMPVGLALGIYGTSGYAPIRAEMLPYHKSIGSARKTIWEPDYLRPLYRAFLQELRLTNGWRELMERKRDIAIILDLMNIQFKWPGRELVVDPSREEESRRKKMAMGLITREDEVDATDLYEHDLRAAKSLGLMADGTSDEEAIQKYRQMCAASIHQIQLPLGEQQDNSRKEEDE